MTTKELIEKIDGETKGEIIEQAYDLGFKDGYEMGSRDSFDPEASECLKELYGKTEYKIDNKPNPPMLKDYDKFTFDPKLAEEYARKAADISGMSLEEFVKVNNKPVEVINHPKHIIVNGALYEKIDDAVLTIANGYGDMI